MSVAKKITAIADAARFCLSSSNKMKIRDIITGLSDFVGYDLPYSEEQINSMTLDETFSVLADVIRYGTGYVGLMDLDKMAELIFAMSSAVAFNDKGYYEKLEDAIAECDDGGTVTLLKSFDVGNLSNVAIDKSVTLDGRNHTITRKTGSDTLFVIKKDGVTFNIQSVIADVNLGSGECFLYGNNISANVNISDSDITSTENVLFLRYATCNVTVNSSTLNAGLRNIQFNYCSGNVEVNNSNLYGGRSDANAFLIFDSEVDACIKNSNLYGKDSPALSVRYSDISLLIDNSYVQAGNTLLGAIDVQNCSPIVDLKNSTKILIDSETNASIRMRGSSNCDPIITLYDSVMLTKGLEGHIYYTEYGKRTGFHIRFSDNYVGSWFTSLSNISTDKNCVLKFVDSLMDAGFYALVNKNIDTGTPMDLSGKDLTIKSATIVNSETGDVKSNPCRIYYNGFDSMFKFSALGSLSVLDVEGLKLLADHGSVFNLNGGRSIVQTKSCIIQGNPILEGFTVGEDTFKTYDVSTKDALVGEGHIVNEMQDENLDVYYSVIV